MKNMTLKAITKVTGGSFHGDEGLLDIEVSSITTDSRKIEKDCLFVAIKGARSDGHDFICGAINDGAVCVISEVELSDPNIPYILVESSLVAIKDMARFYREGLNVKVVGITGSVGKTSTKEVIASVLSKKYKTLKTLGNFNNELGLPLTIFRLQEDDEIAVLEMGISDFNEMHRLSSIAKPDVCVITNIGICHLENLGSRDGILKAKSEIFDYMNPQGAVILNGEDDKLALIEDVKGIIPSRFGESKECDAYSSDVISAGLRGTYFTLNMDQESIQVKVPIPGKHMVTNSLAAALVGKVFGMELEEIKKGIEELTPLSGRNNIIAGKKYTVIDDCYNANPVSMKASIDVLTMADTRKVAILGDMGELGEDEVALHKSIGQYAKAALLDLCIFVGKLSYNMYTVYVEDNSDSKAYWFETVEELLDNIDSLLEENDSVLVKASHFMGFDRIVDSIK